MRVVAIDGPSGSGKSTVARRLADQLGLDYLDTGAMYRGVAFAALQAGVDPDDAAPVAKLAEDIELVSRGSEIVVNGADASVEIRGPEVTKAVSTVAANPDVRREMVSRQREWIRAHGGGVVEGRDIGNEVWPDAELKVYLTADLAVRAARRGQEMGVADEQWVAEDLARRDNFDASREASPLQLAADAVVVDTTGRSVDEIVVELLAHLER
jgi:cytidylate kinase